MRAPEPSSVRTLRDGEVDAVADLHRQAFPHYQSSQLGDRFCRRLLRGYAASGRATVLVAFDPAGSAVGYLVGAPPAVQREINDRLVPWAALASIGLATRAPRRAWRQAAPARRRAARAVIARARPGAPGGTVDLADGRHPDAPMPTADVRVVLVAVSARARGTGVADALLREFARWACEQGHTSADLSVAADNEAARRAYERNGWRAGSLEGGGGSRRYWLDVGDGGPVVPPDVD